MGKFAKYCYWQSNVFEDPDDYGKEFSIVGYGPEVDFPSRIEELVDCFSNFDFTIEVHKLHPLVGVIVANRNENRREISN